ncbi:MAG: manganese efflux pump MntP family protein [Bacteroidaceae bacterium]|nr:manganese efflux pump MntP family protein [Bacteroidaceae bacterium]
MSELEIWLLAVGLAMDCFSVSMASGLAQGHWNGRPMLLMAFCFGIFQAFMPLIGWVLTASFEKQIEFIDHWIAFALLLYLGINMILDDRRGEEEKKFDTTRIAVILTLSVATSIDALAVGISFTCTGFTHIQELWHPILVIGFMSSVLSLAGSIIGIYGGHLIARRLHPGLLGGLILIVIGCRILIEHLSA